MLLVVGAGACYSPIWPLPTTTKRTPTPTPFVVFAAACVAVWV